MMEATGLHHPVELTRRHIVRRLSDNQIRFEESIFPKVAEGALLSGDLTEDHRISHYWNRVGPHSFQPLPS